MLFTDPVKDSKSQREDPYDHEEDGPHRRRERPDHVVEGRQLPRGPGEEGGAAVEGRGRVHDGVADQGVGEGDAGRAEQDRTVAVLNESKKRVIVL